MSPDLHTFVGPYVLDALDDDERRRFEEHMERCAACREEVADLVEVTGALAESVAEPVPASLRARVLSEVETTRQELPLAGRRPSHRWRRLATVAAAAALLAVAVLGVSLWRQAEGQLTEAEELVAITAAADGQRTVLESDIGTLQVIVSESRGRMAVVGDEVPDPADERTYELWSITDEGPTSLGTFDPADGAVQVVVDAPGADAGQVGITEEPDGGSPAPTGPILASGTL